jgi:hypothetical protein
MKRFITQQPNEGLPYVNSDFYDVFQNQHIKAYGSILDNMNDLKIGSSTNLNKGIIVNGIRIVTPYNSETTTMTLDLKNSLVYIPGPTETGDFYEPEPTLLENKTYTITSESFYIFVVSATASSRQFYSGTFSSVTTQNYYTIETELPETAELDKLVYIKFHQGQSSRYLERLIRWNTSDYDQIFISGDGIQSGTFSNGNPKILPKNFDLSTGRGFGDMYGFALCDGRNGTVNLKGRMVLGYDRLAPTTPLDNTNLKTAGYDSTGVINYGVPKNFGGGRLVSNVVKPGYFLKPNQLPAHNHSGSTSPSDTDCSHRHTTFQGNPGDGSDNFDDNFFPDTAMPIRGWNRERGGIYTILPKFITENIVGENTNDNFLALHKHPIHLSGSDDPHETRPPYLVIAYYQKINLTLYG